MSRSRCLLSLPRLLGWLLLLAMVPARATTSPAVALYYGDNPPWNELRAFDVVVVEPDHPGLDPAPHQHADSAVFAYASVGEVLASRPYYKDIPAAWLKGRNAAWQSRIIDQSAPGWPAFFVEKVLAPLWARGYRGFFLDTLDSWQMIAKTPAEQARQQAGLVAVIRAIKARWPEARLIFNRGFEILPQVHDLAWMVAAESLYQGYGGSRGYAPVSAEDRDWLLGQLRRVQREYRLPVLAIDYVPPENRQLARDTAKKIRDLGFIPWVSNGELDALGIGAVEVLPRKVLMLYQPRPGLDIQVSEPQRFLGIMLSYLGLVPEFHTPADAPPAQALDRYAGVIAWLPDNLVLEGTAWPDWLAAQARAGLPLVFFNALGVGEDHALLSGLGLATVDVASTPSIQTQSSLMGFELATRPRSPEAGAVRLQGPGRALLTLRANNGQPWQPAALTPWGGYALAPYVVESLPGKDMGERWLLNPLGFLRAALRIDGRIPVPDVSTETGRRLFFVHIDGDGFASRAEMPGDRYAGEVLRDELLRPYPWPTTMSVIEGEVGPAGLYPQLSPRLEQTARDIFALPQVELASHTYSHPFYWAKAEQSVGAEDAGAYHLAIKGYRYDLRREIEGSRDYIDSRLAPAGKKTRILLWSGNCVATPAALAEVKRAGLLNMNGGDTNITRSRNSWTRMAGLGVEREGMFQVFAPNQNENVYTNDWTGPFYGFERVIETYELTDKPYRFKPVNLYYHVYAASKPASLESLRRIYRWVSQQSLHPVLASDYIHKVLDYNSMVLARTPDGYRVRGQGELRNLHIPAPAAGLQPDWAASAGVAGMSPAPEGMYLALSGDSADIVFKKPGKSLPYLASANARLSRFQRQGRNLSLGFSGYMPLRFALAQADACTLSRQGQPLKASRSSDGLQHYQLDSHAESSLELRCQP